MKSNQKKILSLMLALVMIVSTAFMAFNTYAEDVEPEAGIEEVVVEETAEEADAEVDDKAPAVEDEAAVVEDSPVDEASSDNIDGELPAEEAQENPVDDVESEVTADEAENEEPVTETPETTDVPSDIEEVEPEIADPIEYTYVAPTFRAIPDAPANKKKLIDNGDGTYTIALSVTGAAESSSTTEATKANVILVLDTSSSMVNNRPGGNGTPTRLALEQDALTKTNGIIDNLLKQNVPGDPIKKDIIEVAIVDFGNKGQITQTWTTDGTTLKNTINGLTTSQGTNWEEGLRYAKDLADTKKTAQPNEDIYIIFMTDGEPTTHYNSYNVNWQNINDEWTAARDDARGIVTAGYKFYALFTWGASNNAHYLSSLVQYAYTGSGNSNTALAPAYQQYYTNADSTEAVIAALSQIVDDITNSVGYTNVEMTDGVTSMTASSASATVDGHVTGLKYYRSGGSYSTTANNGLGEEWTGAPEATITNGVVDWDLGSLVLENGVTYTIAFVVWPKQASLDLVADLNNGKIKYTDLSDEQKASIVVSGGAYSLKTNTDYPTVKYSTITTTTHSDGTTTTNVSDPVILNIENPKPVGLAGSEMVIRKIWAVDLQSWRLQGLLYNDDGTSKKLTVTLDIYRDNVYFDSVTLGWVEVEDDPETEEVETGYYDWADAAETIWEDSFAVAPGVMTTTADMAAYAKKTFTYNGKTYYVLETGHDYELRENDFKDYHFDLVTRVYHPMIVDGVLRDVLFTYSGSEIIGIEAIGEEVLTSIDATNTLRGGINLNKIVLDPQGNEYPTEDEFTFTIKLDNTSSVFTGDSIPWYSINGNYYHDADGNFISEDEAIRMYGDDYQNYGNILSGSATSVSGEITITCLDSVRIANVPVGTTFTITEAAKDGFTLDSIIHKTQLSDGTDQKDGIGTITLADRKIEAEIIPNRENNITFKNKMTEYPAFYVYHSSDNSIEKIFVNGDDRVARTTDTTTGLSTYTFNIVNEVKADYLYGGYYKAYAGTTAKDAEIIALTYTEDTAKVTATTYDGNHTGGFWADDQKGNEYTGAKATAWSKTQAYTTADGCGLEMNPKANTVYYLKEVPNSYIRPYIHIVYDINHTGSDGNPDNPLTELRMITAVDDANYTDAGFYYVENSTPDEKTAGRLATLVNISQNGATVKALTAKSIFGAKVYPDRTTNIPRGYLTVVNLTDSLDSLSTFTMHPYFKTFDGVMVYGITERAVDLGEKRFVKGDDGTGIEPGITTTDTTKYDVPKVEAVSAGQ